MASRFINLEEPQERNCFDCDTCGQPRSKDVLHILESNNVTFNGTCHHEIEDKNLTDKVFEECVKYE